MASLLWLPLRERLAFGILLTAALGAMTGGISGTITYLVSPTEPLSVLVILAWTTAISAAVVGFGPQVAVPVLSSATSSWSVGS